MIQVKTEIVIIDISKNLESQLHQAVNLILSGELVAFPTETVYGLGADALNPNAVKKIFEAKGRPSDNPLIVHVSSKSMLYRLIDRDQLSQEAEKLIECFFPGPLTLILKKSKHVPSITTGGLDTIAVRYPSNKIAYALIKFSNTPIAAPSANISGTPSTTTASDVLEDFNGIIPLVIDGGNTDIGLESTVVDISDSKRQIKILRPGKITLEDITSCIGVIEPQTVSNIDQNTEVVRSPGMKYRHYAPKNQLIFIETIDDLITLLKNTNIRKKSFIVERGVYNKIQSRLNILNEDQLYIYNSTQELGVNLYSTLRKMDRLLTIDAIVIQFKDDSGFGKSIYNRLKKAASS